MSKTAYINDKPFEIKEGETILSFMRRHHGQDSVPTLCDAPNLDPFGSCRVCSVDVALEKEGNTKAMASCHTPVMEGNYIYPDSDNITRLRKNIIELVLTDHPLECLTCEVNGNCELQTVAARVGITDVRYPEGETHTDREKDKSHPYMTSDLSKCINCYRCVRACDEVQGQFVLSMAGRGFDSHIVKGMDESFMDSDCVSCGACSFSCPSYIPLAQYFNYAKGKVKANLSDARKQELTKDIADARLLRIEREMKAKKEMLAKRKAEQAAKKKAKEEVAAAAKAAEVAAVGEPKAAEAAAGGEPKADNDNKSDNTNEGTEA